MLKKIFVLSLLVCNICFAQAIPVPNLEFNPKKYVCYKTSVKLKVDGKLDEADWEKAKWTDYFEDIEGAAKPEPRFKTRAKMLWDDEYFYIAAELSEPHIWGKLKNRDDIIFFDNDFEVFIDPDGDSHGYVEFEMNALNTVWDLLLIQPYRDIDNAALHQFDMKKLTTGVEIFGTLNDPSDIDDKWTVEIAFPWKGFDEVTNTPTPPENNDQWRVNFSRVQWHTEVIDGNYEKIKNKETGKSLPEDNWVWSPQGVVNMHYPEMWGYVQFNENTVGSKSVEFVNNQDEEVKWYLRNLYYQQRIYQSDNNKYADSIDELKMKRHNLLGYKDKIEIHTSLTQYEARLYSKDGNHYFQITQNGKISKIE